jgi:Ni,Fe-hydrogenase I cytochrome b subunit
MAEHKHGTMNIEEQQKTFAGFVRGTIWVGAICIAALIFMAVFNS